MGSFIKKLLGLDKIERLVERIDIRLSNVENTIKNYSEVLFDVVSLLSIKKIIEMRDIKGLKELMVYKPSKGTSNPFTQQEINHLKKYIEMVEKEEEFTSEQANHFQKLVKKASYEKTGDDVKNLILASAIVFGLYYLSKNK